MMLQRFKELRDVGARRTQLTDCGGLVGLRRRWSREATPHNLNHHTVCVLNVLAHMAEAANQKLQEEETEED